MTVAELIAELSKHSADTAVCVVVEDEFDCTKPVDVVGVDRVVRRGAIYLEVIGAI